MSKDFKFKLNGSGVRALLQSEQMQSILSEKASQIRNRCGSGYAQDIHVGKNRANAMVYADDFKAKIDNSKNNTILKAIK